MKQVLKKFEAVMMAAAFAEVGEFETAREFLREEDRTRNRPNVTPRPTARKTMRAD